MLRWIDVLKFAKYSNPEPREREEKTDEEWQQKLTPEQYNVMRQKGTESPYRNAYCRSYEPGIYTCVGCGTLLFNATEKYHAISGWPSFTQPSTKGAIKYMFDDSHNMQRIEVQCNTCDSHLGHVFNDGPVPHGLRYCINSASIQRVDLENDHE
ncbi:peptide-methionine (R)-S-oxide reductase MsrB [Pontibacter akesuensis]|uniref:peptide-methionine (R)-S-oxide reductase n=1 Tax=Pontibacter akesuensis TaxID=388950 RepID=A0A1I7KT56_9BACT|nr:peptide-methionine (R)-S-oxide reductase MsrB [Pontibacter akesuensis]GHA80763.1 peptide-methionine (R)-S-oxide reductase [Pontibacter akesuensis]SFV00643.1 peptide-methionine (R)-S-oxide reductase [Pontibacter akesuensis]